MACLQEHEVNLRGGVVKYTFESTHSFSPSAHLLLHDMLLNSYPYRDKKHNEEYSLPQYPLKKDMRISMLWLKINRVYVNDPILQASSRTRAARARQCGSPFQPIQRANDDPRESAPHNAGAAADTQPPPHTHTKARSSPNGRY